MKKKNKGTIFIQLASYRNPELLPTIKDCIAKAKYPKNLVFSITWQHSPEDVWDNLSGYTNDKRFKIVDIPYKESEGVCWARHKLQQNYNDEEYTLQLDSHHRFAENWDEELINMYKQLQELGYKKPLLTGYLPSYEPGDDPAGRINIPWLMNFDRFSPDGILHTIPATLIISKNLPVENTGQAQRGTGRQRQTVFWAKAETQVTIAEISATAYKVTSDDANGYASQAIRQQDLQVAGKGEFGCRSAARCRRRAGHAGCRRPKRSGPCCLASQHLSPVSAPPAFNRQRRRPDQASLATESARGYFPALGGTVTFTVRVPKTSECSLMVTGHAAVAVTYARAWLSCSGGVFTKSGEPPA